MGPDANSPLPINDANRIETLASQLSDYVQHSKASSTLHAYDCDWRRFTEWCQSLGKNPLPASPETVALFLTDLSTRLKSSTLSRRCAAICQAHRKVGFDSPTRDLQVRMVLSGIRRTHGIARASKKALLVPDLKRIVSGLPSTLQGCRDKSLLLLGFCGALRRSEIVALDKADVEFIQEGLAITIRRSKTDQMASGRRIGIPYTSSAETCPVRSLLRWIEAGGITEGPIFRRVAKSGRVLSQRLTAHAVAKIVKRRVKPLGFDPRQYSAHSLRSGLATAAAMTGASERAIMNQTRHRSLIQVRRYIQAASLFKDNVVLGLGL